MDISRRVRPGPRANSFVRGPGQIARLAANAARPILDTRECQGSRPMSALKALQQRLWTFSVFRFVFSVFRLEKTPSGTGLPNADVLAGAGAAGNPGKYPIRGEALPGSPGRVQSASAAR